MKFIDIFEVERSVVLISLADLELFFDWLPDKAEKNEKFKKFIWELQFLPDFADTNLKIKKDSIYEVDSKKHIILQCLDIVLGAMAFRLNKHHRDIPEGQKEEVKERKQKSMFTSIY